MELQQKPFITTEDQRFCAEKNKNQNHTQDQTLAEKKVRDLILEKRRLVEVPYTASLAHTMNTLVANRVVAVPVAAPPGQWIGAGGSMIMESDKQTGALRKQYIGMVTMLDILAHIGGDDRDMDGGDELDLERKMAVPVSSVIGHSLEGLSLWTLNPNTSIFDCMEVLSKGIHRALVPEDGKVENISGVELVEAATSYRMVTQMDVLRFLKQHSSHLQPTLSRTVQDLKAVNENVLAITDATTVIEAINGMKAGLLSAVPIVRRTLDASIGEDYGLLVDGRGKKLVGTFSATDLRGCHLSTLQTWLPLTALEFTETISTSPIFATFNADQPQSRGMITCHLDSLLGEVMDKLITNHVHRTWVVDQEGFVLGIVSITDIIRVLRLSIMSKC